MIDFAKEIEKVLTSREDKAVPLNEFHCHYAGYCKRQIWNAKKGKMQYTTDVLGKMMVGTIIHRWLSEITKHLGRNEVPLVLDKGDIIIKGTADFVDDEMVYDFKTEANLRYLPRTEGVEGETHRTYREFHEPQLQLYMDGLGKSKAALVYIDKTDLKTKQFELKRNEQMITEVIEKYREVYKELDKDENPFDYCDCFLCESEKNSEGLDDQA